MKPDNSSPCTSAEEKISDDLELPEVSKDSAHLIDSRPPPTFAEQIAHARMLLKWKNGAADHPPRQHERFEM